MGAGHDHAHGIEDNRKVLWAVLGITLFIFCVEVLGAIVTKSLALFADAGHMFVDSFGLMMSLFVAYIVQREATEKHTWGMRRAEVISAMVQALVLIGVGIYVLVEAVRRMFEPVEMASKELLIFGCIGLLANLLSFTILTRSAGENFNIRAATLEVLNDALGSMAVIIAAIVIALTGWYQADAVVSLIIGAMILPRAFKLLRETTSVLLETTPEGLDLTQVKEHILSQEHVQGVHDIHASQIDSSMPVLTAHIVLDNNCFTQEHYAYHLDQLRSCLGEHFSVAVEHTTFQLETAEFAEKLCHTHD
ncbi:MAG: cation diffusion facilitator family transporter [Micrococcaceae bacterium]